MIDKSNKDWFEARDASCINYCEGHSKRREHPLVEYINGIVEELYVALARVGDVVTRFLAVIEDASLRARQTTSSY